MPAFQVHAEIRDAQPVEATDERVDRFLHHLRRGGGSLSITEDGTTYGATMWIRAQSRETALSRGARRFIKAARRAGFTDGIWITAEAAPWEIAIQG